MNYEEATTAFLAGFIVVHLAVILMSFIIWENALKVLGYWFVFRMSFLIGTVCLISYMVKS